MSRLGGVVVSLLVSGCASQPSVLLQWPAVPIYADGTVVRRPITYTVYAWPSNAWVGTTQKTHLVVNTPGCWFITARAQGGAEGWPNEVMCYPIDY